MGHGKGGKGPKGKGPKEGKKDGKGEGKGGKGKGKGYLLLTKLNDDDMKDLPCMDECTQACKDECGECAMCMFDAMIGGCEDECLANDGWCLENCDGCHPDMDGQCHENCEEDCNDCKECMKEKHGKG